MAFFGKEGGQFELVRLAPNGNLPPFFFFCKAVFNCPLDVKVLDIAFTFRLAQRNEHIPVVALAVSICLDPR